MSKKERCVNNALFSFHERKQTMLRNFICLNVLISLCLYGASSFADNSPALIAVTGVAEKSIDPNMLSLNIEVWSKALAAKAAQSLAAQEHKSIQKVFEQFKIKKEDIQTQSYSLNPEYIYEEKTQQNKIVGYRAVQILRVVLRKVEDGGSFIDALSSSSKGTSSGINLNSISWDTDQRDNLQAAGVLEAVKQARFKADEMAKAAGVKIKRVYRLTSGVVGNDSIPMTQGYAKSMSLAQGAPTDLSGGQVKVRVEVQAEFEIN